MVPITIILTGKCEAVAGLGPALVVGAGAGTVMVGLPLVGLFQGRGKISF